MAWQLVQCNIIAALRYHKPVIEEDLAVFGCFG